VHLASIYVNAEHAGYTRIAAGLRAAADASRSRSYPPGPSTSPYPSTPCSAYPMAPANAGRRLRPSVSASSSAACPGARQRFVLDMLKTVLQQAIR
jgi:hypothetical protein